jgi:hypothetical protein
MEKQGGMAFGFRKTATAVIKPERWIVVTFYVLIKSAFVGKKTRNFES